MGTFTVRKQSAASVSLPASDQLKFFVDSADNILKSKDYLGVVRPQGSGTADELATTGSPVVVSSAAPPVAGQVLTAISPTVAIWDSVPAFLTPTAVQTSGSYAAAVGELVLLDVSSSAVTVDLPATHVAGNVIGVKLVSVATNSGTIDPNGSQTVDGNLTLDLTTAYEWAILCSDGTNWLQIG